MKAADLNFSSMRHFATSEWPGDVLQHVDAEAMRLKALRDDGEILLTTRLQRWVKDAAHPARQAWARKLCAILNKHDDGHC